MDFRECGIAAVTEQQRGLRIAGRNSVLCAIDTVNVFSLYQSLFPQGEPSWLSYCEVVEVDCGSAGSKRHILEIDKDGNFSVPPEYATYFGDDIEDVEFSNDEYSDDYEDEEEESDDEPDLIVEEDRVYINRFGGNVADVLNYVPSVSKPTFGRKLLYCKYLSQLDAPKVMTLRRELRSQLPQFQQQTWVSADSEAYLFIDNRQCAAVLAKLHDRFDQGEVVDYLMAPLLESVWSNTESDIRTWLQRPLRKFRRG